MKHPVSATSLVLAAALGAAGSLSAQTADKLMPNGVKIETVTYRGKRAVSVTGNGEKQDGGGGVYALIKDVRFHNGSIDVDLAGVPGHNASDAARGFIGVAFRVQDAQYEYIYLRPMNGRAEDQVRRNHSTQYSSFPKYDFGALRRESPEKYESYVDLEPGVWTHYRITVQGTTARLFVNGSQQPVLIVTDLKLGDSTGGVGLWIEPSTQGYFSGLSIKPSP